MGPGPRWRAAGRQAAGRAARLGAVGLLLGLAAGCSNITREELRCEEAVARIMDCCPGLAASPVACEYRQSTSSPYIYTFPRVECLVGLSCAGLQDRGACTWAATPPPRAEICP